MLTSEEIRAWVCAQYGPRHADRRITDIGFAYSVDTRPDAVLDGGAVPVDGAGPAIVVKRTGGIWQFGSHPMFLPLYATRTEDDFRRSLAALLPQCDPDAPPQTIAPGAHASPPASPPGFGPAFEPAPSPAYGPPVHAPGPPVHGPGPAAVAGPEFIAADRNNAVLVDAAGVSFDQGHLHVEFGWHEVRAMHHAVLGLCLVVTVEHTNGARYECRVGTRRQARLREWCAQLAPVVGHYLGGHRPA